MNELPSAALTQRFLILCEQYGSERLPVQVVAVGRSTGVEGLPAGDDWTTWRADEMQAAVDYLQRKRGLTRVDVEQPRPPTPAPLRYADTGGLGGAASSSRGTRLLRSIHARAAGEIHPATSRMRAWSSSSRRARIGS